MTSTTAAPEIETLLLDLVSRAQALPKLHTRLRSWKARITSVDQGHACYWCNATGVPLVPDHIISPSCGGSNASANVVMACMSCERRKGTHDSLAWCQTDAKRQRRMDALASSLNHPLVQPIRHRATVHKHLAKRWTHERFTVYQSGPHLCWPNLSPPPGHIIAALRSMGARVDPAGRWTVVTLHGRTSDALAMLLDCNALLRGLDSYGPQVLPDAAAVVRYQMSLKPAAVS